MESENAFRACRGILRDLGVLGGLRMTRPLKELQEIVAATIAVSKGTAPFVILARSRDEVIELERMLKGKHGAKFITVKEGQ